MHGYNTFMMEDLTVAIVGAGPIGLELALELSRAGVPFVIFDKGQAAQMIYNYPPETRFFSSSDRIAIAGLPIQTIDQQKCSREQYLAYIRSAIMQERVVVNSYEEVLEIERLAKGFVLKTSLGKSYSARYVVLATGGTSKPRLLGVEGEDLPHVFTKMDDPHCYFQKRVVVIGSKNSAAETALRCSQAGAEVSLIVRRKDFDSEHIKYWILPELKTRIACGEIAAYFQSCVKKILPGSVSIACAGEMTEIPADFVIKAIGFVADMSLFEQLGVPLIGDQRAPEYNEKTMETKVPGLFVAGTIVAGTQNRYRLFIENSHVHVDRILETLGIARTRSSAPFIRSQLEQ